MMNRHLSLRRAIPVVLIVLASCTGGERAEKGAATDQAAAPAAEAPMLVSGFASSEAVRHDTDADVYLVANINGSPGEKDDNGFISRVSPEGEVVEMRWIDGARGDFELNAPKGMALKADTLFVADIDVLRAFDRTSGTHLQDRPVEGAQFLNDVAVGSDGTVWVTDTAGQTIYRFDGLAPVAVASGATFGNPNGVDIDATGVTVVMWNGGAKRIDPATGEFEDLPAPEGEQLDGVVLMEDGSYLVSSWALEAVVRVASDGTVTEVAGGIAQAADIGFDFSRGRLLVPTFANELHIVPLQ
jgi:hypothetical protein